MRSLPPCTRGAAIVLLGCAWPGTATAQLPAGGTGVHPPPWLHVSGSFVSRVESLDERLRIGETGSNGGLFTRALVEITAKDSFTEATLELMDARLTAEPADARPTTGQVNTVDIVQAYFAATGTDAFTPGDELRVLAGRHTFDLGGRRLVARPIYRNTLNSFTGLNATWTGPSGRYARAFYTLPVQRLPGNGDRARLLDGTIRSDEERVDTRFFGAVYGEPIGPLDSTLELTWLALHEQDAPDSPTANRRLHTFEARFVRPARPGGWSWELDSALQIGSSRASAAAAERLDHQAYLHHATLGYTFDRDWSPRIDALFDMASGDRAPGDGENNRFDSLFGIPRQDFGPTGTFRAIARTNLVSPGLRITVKPTPRLGLVLMQRFNYLASDRDAWSNGYVDPSGQSGSHIGNLTELVAQYDVSRDRSVRLELGAAFHDAGSFAERTVEPGTEADALFGYAQISFWF